MHQVSQANHDFGFWFVGRHRVQAAHTRRVGVQLLHCWAELYGCKVILTEVPIGNKVHSNTSITSKFTNCFQGGLSIAVSE